MLEEVDRGVKKVYDLWLSYVLKSIVNGYERMDEAALLFSFFDINELGTYANIVERLRDLEETYKLWLWLWWLLGHLRSIEVYPSIFLEIHLI